MTLQIYIVKNYKIRFENENMVQISMNVIIFFSLL